MRLLLFQFHAWRSDHLFLMTMKKVASCLLTLSTGQAEDCVNKWVRHFVELLEESELLQKWIRHLKPKTVIDRRPQPPTPPKGPVEKAKISRSAEQDTIGAGGEVHPRVNLDNVLEERDPRYDAMLGQMAGRIRTKPGGKPEMGEAFVVEKHNRTLPKLRNTKPGSARYEERHVPEGTLNVAQLRHVVLLHEGKADDHNGPMNVHLIAEKFRVDASQIQRILQCLSLPPEDSIKEKNRTPR
ncbi:hypothetical protein L6164_012558 [Bauhinia variegata]|uniref:Uncharacterized protein n=1 Tax=Bauhinia variegata TaxID=167791 RepID=A0ACB9PAH2_BAUVA|nr:hypothetical protein L6164_012558 [Bauhinia variegata]